MARILVSWIGRNDLLAYQKASEGATTHGPVLSTLLAVKFARAFLIYNYDDSEISPYITWLSRSASVPVEAAQVPLISPVHFGDIHQAADAGCLKSAKSIPGTLCAYC